MIEKKLDRNSLEKQLQGGYSCLKFRYSEKMDKKIRLFLVLKNQET